eukprot:3198229-Rhodomonas_salina.3
MDSMLSPTDSLVSPTGIDERCSATRSTKMKVQAAVMLNMLGMLLLLLPTAYTHACSYCVCRQVCHTNSCWNHMLHCICLKACYAISGTRIASFCISL